MQFVYNDGGRAAAGFRGTKVGDCVARSIAITANLPYTLVYDRLAMGNATQRITKNSRGRNSCGKFTASEGIYTTRKWFLDYMRELGFIWIPCMRVGTGCMIHLREDQLPKGRIIVKLSRHYCAVIDGVIHDIYDGSREGTRCVYGYWRMP